MPLLDSLQTGMHVHGLRPNQLVTLISIQHHGSDTATITYRTPDGQLGEDLLTAEDISRLTVEAASHDWTFDAPADHYLLALEAYRIELAAMFDPRLAIHTSLVEPLPHQILAVYESMLPRTPLRFLLADDPGAGKTIMAGLYIRELMIRGDLKRCLIVTPGSLCDQWQEELHDKFRMNFEVATREKLMTAHSGNWFNEHNCVIARIDQLARYEFPPKKKPGDNENANDQLKGLLEDTSWDLVIVDEAHKMSAHYFGNEKKETKRFKLGKLLGPTTRNLLLMTATPHNGKEEDFQLFLSLVDPDRFEGKYDDKKHLQTNPADLMRRMTKEKLVRFNGKPLFPERRAYVADYELSPGELELYEDVTSYVQNEFDRAKALKDGKRKGTVGFAMTVLQRRLASSPNAIYRSLARRRDRLQVQLEEATEKKAEAIKLELAVPSGELPSVFTAAESTQTDHDYDDFYDDLPADELEDLEDEIVDAATSALTIDELRAEIGSLEALVEQADEVRRSGTDTKWAKLREILDDNPHMKYPDGRRRKLVIFTEHRDTLDYLAEQIRTLLGRNEAVVIIKGGMPRQARKAAETAFKNEKEVEILLATDAAGEGINLQVAHLMVNYDLPWNPNRLEQRFGRIHRIGQIDVCHLWNLLAGQTREGAVYQRLLEKLEVAREALGGAVFDVLGQVFRNQPLKDLLMDAILYGEQPEVKARLDKTIDGAVDQEHIRNIIETDVLLPDSMDTIDLQRIREEMEEANLKCMQPHYVRQFFERGFAACGGRLDARSGGCYEITHVPARIKNHANTLTGPIARGYERVTFDKSHASSTVDLVCPGHPLFDAVLRGVLEDYRHLLRQGTVLIDDSDESEEPYALVALEHAIRDGELTTEGQQRVVSREAQFVRIYRDGRTEDAGFAPHINMRAATDEEGSLIDAMLEDDWFEKNLEQEAESHAIAKLAPTHKTRIENQRLPRLERTSEEVHRRLTTEINHWDGRYLQLKAKEDAGKQPKMNAIDAQRRAEELKARLDARQAEIQRQMHLSSSPPTICSGAFVVPINAMRAASGDVSRPDQATRERIDRLAVDAVLAAERTLGRDPVEMKHNNPGYDIRSYHLDDNGNRTGESMFIEVKGKGIDQSTVTISATQINMSFNQPDKWVLAIVKVDGDSAMPPRYIRQPFQQRAVQAVSKNFPLSDLLSRSTDPS